MKKVAVSIGAIIVYYIVVNLLSIDVTKMPEFMVAVLYVFLPIVFVPLAIHFVFERLHLNDTTQKMRGAIRAAGFKVSHAVNVNGSGIFIDAQSRKLCCFVVKDPKTIVHWIQPFDKVLTCRLVQDGDQITKASSTDVVGRALMGGLLFGGVGAIIGGTTATATSSKNIRSLQLEVVADDENHPIHRVDFVKTPAGIEQGSPGAKKALEEAQLWQALMELVLLNEKIPPANSISDLTDLARMIKIRTEKRASRPSPSAVS